MRTFQAFTRLIGDMWKLAEDRPTETGQPDGAGNASLQAGIE